FFSSNRLNPEWSLLGYTTSDKYSLTDRSGWLHLSPKSGKMNTVTKNDGEHNYALITRLEFDAKSVNDEAGLIILRGDEGSAVKLFSSINASGQKTITFNFDNTKYETANSAGDTVWLRIVRINHSISGYFSGNGIDWNKVGETVNSSTIDSYSDFSSFTGTRQGLYVRTSPAYFDFYIYRNAYTPILAECPANQYGTTVSSKVNGISSLDNIHDNDWALYAGVEFGNSEYVKYPDSLTITASCVSAGGIVEVWIDSLDTGTKIAECTVSSTGSWAAYRTFTAKVLTPVSGNHDLYVKFKGSGTGKLLMLQWLIFKDSVHPETPTSVGELQTGQVPGNFELGQNFPNPFNPATMIHYRLPAASTMSLKVYNLLGEVVATLYEGVHQPGNYETPFDGSKLASGVYLYRMNAMSSGGSYFVNTKKLMLVK
ncbi:MAG: carbohydrate-binding protein, partial [Ignavibacteriae bacterium]